MSSVRPARFRPARRTCAVCMCVARYLVADQKARPLDKSTVHELRQRGGHVPWRYNEWDGERLDTGHRAPRRNTAL